MGPIVKEKKKRSNTSMPIFMTLHRYQDDGQSTEKILLKEKTSIMGMRESALWVYTYKIKYKQSSKTASGSICSAVCVRGGAGGNRISNLPSGIPFSLIHEKVTRTFIIIRPE